MRQGVDSPGPACVALSVLPCPPPGWQKGAPWGGGRARGSHDTQAGPASCLAASEAHGSLQSRYFNPLRDGEAPVHWPGRGPGGHFCPAGFDGAPLGARCWAGSHGVHVQCPLLPNAPNRCQRLGCLGHWLPAGQMYPASPGEGQAFQEGPQPSQEAVSDP